MSFKDKYDQKHVDFKQKEANQAKVEAWLLEVVKEVEEVGWVAERVGNKVHVKDKHHTVCYFDIIAKTGSWSRHHVTASGCGLWQDEYLQSPSLGFLRSMIHDYIIDCAIVYNQRPPITKAEEKEL